MIVPLERFIELRDKVLKRNKKVIMNGTMMNGDVVYIVDDDIYPTWKKSSAVAIYNPKYGSSFWVYAGHQVKELKDDDGHREGESA